MADPKREAPGMSPTLHEIESNQLRCPEGHVLPHKTTQGDCTPLYCSMPSKARNFRGRPETAASVPIKQLAPADVEDQALLEGRRVSLAKARGEARRKAMQVPEGLTGAEAEAWADKKLVDALPLAAAEMEFQLRYGDDRARMAAALEIADRTGRGKKEGGIGGGGPILIITAGGDLKLPWLQRATPVEPVKSGALEAVSGSNPPKVAG